MLLASQIREATSRVRKRIKNPAKAKSVTVAEMGDAGAVFDLATKLGSVSDQ